MPLDFDQLFPTLNTIQATGTIRSSANDFKVTEINNIECSGQGEHLWLYIEKINSNTDWIAKQLANICQVPRKRVSFAGLKDRNAITQQWFSIQLPKISDVDQIQSALPPEVIVKNAQRHHKKLKVGQLDNNQFEITIRDINGDRNNIEDNINQVKSFGVPNYFGPQRFGIDLGNISKAQDWFSGSYQPKTTHLKSLLISTSRSHIFNAIVAHRIKKNQWRNAIPGDILQLDGSRSWFHAADATEEEIKQRLAAFDLHITAAMWGENDVQSTDDCALIESHVAEQYDEYLHGLKKFRLRQDRRSIRINVSDLKYQWQDHDLILTFTLPPGSYATSVIREIIDVS